jgi:hypothetical protein
MDISFALGISLTLVVFILLFIIKSRKHISSDIPSRTRRTGLPDRGAAQAFVPIVFGSVALAAFAVLIGPSTLPRAWQTWYKLHNAAVLAQAPGPDISGLIVGTVLALVWLVLMSLLPIAAGLNSLLDLFDQQRRDPLQLAQEEQERRELESRGFMLLTSRDLQRTAAEALQKGSLSDAYVTQRGERIYLSFEFITEPSQRERAWDMFWRYQAGEVILGTEWQEIRALQLDMLGNSALADYIRAQAPSK